MDFSLTLVSSIIAVIFGVIILIAPRVLNYLVAFYLIIIGVLGIINAINNGNGT